MQRLQIINEAVSQSSPQYDYIIVGAGISGIQAADILTSKPNNKILILQAQTVLGGRIGSLSVGDLQEAKKTPWIWNNIEKYRNAFIEAGATWLEERHLVTIELCKQFGISLREQHSEGSCVYLADKPATSQQLMKNSPYADKIKEVIQIIDRISEDYNKYIFSNMKDLSPKGKELLRKYDAITVDDFLKSVLPDEFANVRDLFDGFFEHSECISGKENSMHEVITKNARSNDVGILKEFLGDFGHEPSFLLNGGTDRLISKFIESIEKRIKNSISSILKLGQQVLTVDNRRSDFITVITEDTQTHKIHKFTCKQVICAAPLAVSRLISFTNISEAKKLIIDNQLRTNAVKSFMIVKHPFWRKHQDGSLHCNGDNLFSSEHMANMSHDISPTDLSCGIQVFFHSGRRLDAWESKFPSQNDNEKKKQYFIDLMSKTYGVKKEDQAKLFEDCIYFEISYMQNQFIRSGFQSNTRPGTFNQVLNIGDTIDALYRDENGITFVGSEYSLEFASYIEGAIRITRQKLFKLIGEKDPLAHLHVLEKQK